MLTGDLKNKIDTIWNAFWSGGIANPIEVIEQITFLIFIRRLDESKRWKKTRPPALKRPHSAASSPQATTHEGRPYDSLRWSRLKNAAPAEMFSMVGEHVFPFLRSLGGDGSTYAHHMSDARFTIPTPALLAKVVDLLDALPMDNRDTKGDLYEYMLGKIASAGQNGQFRTPRHIIQLMVEMTAPTPTDTICDPASGTCGFLVAAGEYLREQPRQSLVHDAKLNQHFQPRHVPRLRL